MTSDGECDDCGWRCPTARYVDRKGYAFDLCDRCLDRAVERRTLEDKLDGMHGRLRAQQEQYRRLEAEAEAMELSGFRRDMADMRAEVDRLKPAVDLLRRLMDAGCDYDGFGDPRCLWCYGGLPEHDADCPYPAAQAFLASLDSNPDGNPQG